MSHENDKTNIPQIGFDQLTPETHLQTGLVITGLESKANFLQLEALMLQRLGKETVDQNFAIKGSSLTDALAPTVPGTKRRFAGELVNGTATVLPTDDLARRLRRSPGTISSYQGVSLLVSADLSSSGRGVIGHVDRVVSYFSHDRTPVYSYKVGPPKGRVTRYLGSAKDLKLGAAAAGSVETESRAVAHIVGSAAVATATSAGAPNTGKRS